MIKHRFSMGLLALAATMLAQVAPIPAAAQGISQKVAVCNPDYTGRCIKPDANGAVPITGSLTPSGTQDANLKQVNGATVNVGAGAAGTGTQRVTTSTDSTIGTVTAVTAITNALPAGSNVIGHVIADTGSTTAVTQATAANLNATVTSAQPFPVGYAMVTGNNNVANAIAQSCVPAAVGKHTYVTGFSFTALGATALANVKATAVGQSYDFQFPAGATSIASPIIVQLHYPYDAGVNTAACATLPAGGAGNTAATASIIGFQQ